MSDIDSLHKFSNSIMDEERPWMEHFKDLRKSAIKIAITIVAVLALCLVFSIHMIDFNGYNIPMLYLEPFNNIAIQLISAMQQDLLPENVSLIQIAPGQAFFAQIHIAVMIGIVFSMPVIVREIGTFVSSALYTKERKTIKHVALPAIALFASGCLFSYFVVVPYTLEFLYRFGEPMGIEAFLNITEFISFVMQFVIAFGLSYQLPVIMWASTKSGIVEPRFWRQNMRYALIAIIIFGAVITPDGSGVTMWFVAGPMIALYFLGMLIVEKKDTKETISTPQEEPTSIN